MQPVAWLVLLLGVVLTAGVSADEIDPRELFRDEAPSGRKTVWQWTDDRGQLHVTEHPGEIPQAMWPRVRKRTLAAGNAGDPEAPGAVRPAPPATPGPAPRAAAPDPAEWTARRDVLVGEYRRALQELDEAGFAVQRAIATGAPPARLAELRSQQSDTAARARDLWARIGEIPAQFAAAGGNEAWLPPLPADLGPPKGEP